MRPPEPKKIKGQKLDAFALGRPTLRYACKECLRRMCQEHYQRKHPLPDHCNANPLPRQQNPIKET